MFFFNQYKKVCYCNVILIILMVILTLLGCEKSESQEQGQEQGDAPAPSTIQQEQVKPAGQLEEGTSRDFEPIHNTTVHYSTPLFKEPIKLNDQTSEFAVLAYFEAGTEYSKQSNSDNDWLTVETGHGTTYMPRWYWTEDSSKSEAVTPLQLLAGSDALFHLYPGSSIEWSFEQLKQHIVANSGSISFDERIISVFRYEDWYGVIFSAFPKYDDFILYRPVLLWLNESNVAEKKESYQDLLSSDTGLPIDSIREITEILLLQGTHKEKVLQLLGEPHFVEASQNLNSTGEEIRVGEIWKYEHPQAHFEVTLFEDAIEGWKWTVPMTKQEQVAISSNQYPYGYQYEFRYFPIVTSIEPEWEWRSNGDLGYTYLWEGNEDVLLLRGDDGGLSGMHYDSSVYAPYQILNEGLGEPFVLLQQHLLLEALHPHSGEKQWSIESETPLTEEQQMHIGRFLNQPIDPFYKEQSSKWVLLGDERRLIDIQSGELQAKYTVQTGEMIFVVNNQYWLIVKSLDDPRYWQAKRFETVLYDVFKERELWTLPGRGSGAVIDEEVLYMQFEGVPVAVLVSNGRQLWKLETSLPQDHSAYSMGGFLILDHYVILPYHSDLLLIRKKDGVLEHQLNDVMFGYPDTYGENTHIQMINRDEQYLYVGSSNGIFSKIKLNGDNHGVPFGKY